jgi:hypothetical protein
MCPTRNRLAVQRAVDAAGGKIVDVGDHRQIGPVDAGGGFHALTTALGAVELTINHRFRDLAYRDAAEHVREGQPDHAIALLRTLGAVSEHDRPVDAWAAMVHDWHQLRSQGADARMYATENAVVDQLNTLARHTLRAAGQLPHKGRWYHDHDGDGIEYAVGDRIRLGANLYRLPQPGGTTVTLRNAAYGTVTGTKRHSLALRLDEDHRDSDGPADITPLTTSPSKLGTATPPPPTAPKAPPSTTPCSPPHPPPPPNAATSPSPAAATPTASTPPTTAAGKTPSPTTAPTPSPSTNTPTPPTPPRRTPNP